MFGLRDCHKVIDHANIKGFALAIGGVGVCSADHRILRGWRRQCEEELDLKAPRVGDRQHIGFASKCDRVWVEDEILCSI